MSEIKSLPTEEFSFYHDPYNDNFVCLKFSGESVEFEASRKSVTIRIPVALWAVIRESDEAAITLDLADKSDEELLEIVVKDVDGRIAAFKKAANKESLNHFARLSAMTEVGCSDIYGIAGNPRERQIEMGIKYYRNERSREQDIREQMKSFRQQ